MSDLPTTFTLKIVKIKNNYSLHFFDFSEQKPSSPAEEETPELHENRTYDAVGYFDEPLEIPIDENFLNRRTSSVRITRENDNTKSEVWVHFRMEYGVQHTSVSVCLPNYLFDKLGDYLTPQSSLELRCRINKWFGSEGEEDKEDNTVVDPKTVRAILCSVENFCFAERDDSEREYSRKKRLELDDALVGKRGEYSVGGDLRTLYDEFISSADVQSASLDQIYNEVTEFVCDFRALTLGSNQSVMQQKLLKERGVIFDFSVNPEVFYKSIVEFDPQTRSQVRRVYESLWTMNPDKDRFVTATDFYPEQITPTVSHYLQLDKIRSTTCEYKLLEMLLEAEVVSFALKQNGRGLLMRDELEAINILEIDASEIAEKSRHLPSITMLLPEIVGAAVAALIVYAFIASVSVRESFLIFVALAAVGYINFYHLKQQIIKKKTEALSLVRKLLVLRRKVASITPRMTESMALDIEREHQISFSSEWYLLLKRIDRST